MEFEFRLKEKARLDRIRMGIGDSEENEELEI
jgi:hypothetical protein